MPGSRAFKAVMIVAAASLGLSAVLALVGVRADLAVAVHCAPFAYKIVSILAPMVGCGSARASASI